MKEGVGWLWKEYNAPRKGFGGCTGKAEENS